MNTYVATIQLLVRADSPEGASDDIGDALKEMVEAGRLQDWAYLRLGGQWLYPSEVCCCDPDDYEEGDFVHD